MDINKYEEAYIRTRRGLGRRKRRISLFKIDKDSLILDYGSGDGLDLVALRELGYRNVVGIDNSLSLLKRIKNFDVILADAHNTGFRTNSLDAIFVNSVIHHLDIIKSLKELSRILRKGGILCIVEQRNSLFRKLLDMVTFSTLSNLSGILKNRRIALSEEYEIYQSWLRGVKKFPDLLRENNFEIEFVKKGPIGIFFKCKNRK